MARFHKFCHLKSCRKPFESDSRNAKYDSEECKAKAKKQAHGRQKRKRDYLVNADERRKSSMSRAQARDAVVNHRCVGLCERCGHFFKVSDLETHHRNGDPFDNSNENLSLVCKPCHAKSDNEWRKAKADGTPIPDMRNFHMTLEEALGGQSFTPVRAVPLVQQGPVTTS